MPVRSAPARWLLIYAIIATAVLIGGVIAIHNRDRLADERGERIEQICAVSAENRQGLKVLTQDDTPLPTLGFPIADNLIATYNEDIAERNARVERTLGRPLVGGCDRP